MSAPDESQRLAGLPDLIKEALERRQRIREERDQEGVRQAALLQAISDFTSTSTNSLDFANQSARPLSASEATIRASLHQGLAALIPARDSCKTLKHTVGDASGVLRMVQQALSATETAIKQHQERCFGFSFLQNMFVKAYEATLTRLQQEKAMQKASLDSSQNQLQMAERQLQEGEHQFQATKAGTLNEVKKLQEVSGNYFAERFDSDARQWAATLATIPPFFRCDWSEPAWRTYNLTLSCRVPFWISGMAQEKAGDGRTPFFVPHLSPLLGSHRTTVLKGKPSDSQSLMQGLILQLATMLPYGATFTLLDPSGAGRAFPMQRSLPFVRPVGVDLVRDLNEVVADIGRIISSYLDAETRSFEALPEQIQANERYEFIVAANFPAGYDRVAIELLQKISQNGPTAGKYLFLQTSAQIEMPHGLKWNDFGELLQLDTDNPPCKKEIGGAPIKMLRAAEGAQQKIVLDRLAAAKQPESNVQWSDITNCDVSKWWTENSAIMLQAPVGSSGRDRLINLWFGVNRDGRPCAHGILGAMPGSGKSNLYHVFLCGLAVRYGPEQLNFYLIDGKMGVEFQHYRRLPHARVVALNSAPELSRSVLAELIAEMERRNELFGKLGVVDLPAYRKLGSPSGPRPRIVLMIDEYQELFEDDRHNQASAHLLTLAQQGRSVGIHLLLGSQRFGAVGMLNQAAVFGSIHLRLAMRMSQADVQGLMEFGRNGKRLVEQCDLPGKIVVNANSGDDNSNEFGKVALLDTQKRTAVLDALVIKAQEEWPTERRFATVVFDGREQPNFVENPQVVKLVRLPKRPTAEAWRLIAIAAANDQGFSVPDWYQGERPVALWLGQELNVHGQARIVLRRRAMENLLLVGENLGVTYGILAGIICSVVINGEPESVRLWIADRSLPGTPWEGMLDNVNQQVLLPLSYQIERTREARQATAWLGSWIAELDRRASLDEAELQQQPTWIFIVAGADRIPQLARATSNYGSPIDSPDGEKLRALYTRGPTLGLHLILTFPSAGPLKQCLDRSQLEHFKHRVVTQMGEADSFLLLGNDQAAKLQRGDVRPLFAIHHDQTGGSTTKFKPYTVDAQMPWSEQLRSLTDSLTRGKENCHVNG